MYIFVGEKNIKICQKPKMGTKSTIKKKNGMATMICTYASEISARLST